MVKGDGMNLQIIMESIKDVNERLECEYSKWNGTDDLGIIEECIWAIQSLETRLNNLYSQAKKHSISCKEIMLPDL